MNVKNVVAAIQEIEKDRNVSKEIIVEALIESLEKAYRRESGVPDAIVEVKLNPDTEEMKLYRKYMIVEEVEDDELEVEFSTLDEGYEIGEYYFVEKPIDELGRAAAMLSKNVIKQKIREAEKQAVYDEYIDQLGDMITAVVESVEEKFAVLNLGNSLAVMPKSAQIEGETYREGQMLKVVLTEVNRDTKGAQVLVSRADAMLVRRLFESEVPEIYDGQVEIKAIAREAGDRTKMAVYSHDPDIDAIGACIGPRGARVHAVIEELAGEKIDIFEWSENMIELVHNALAPAQVMAVFPNEQNKGLVVVVEDDQLSLAIGRRGKNARLAVRLTKQRIDIKSVSEMETAGIDYIEQMREYEASLVKDTVSREERMAEEIALIEEQKEEMVKELNLESIQEELEEETSTEEVVEEIVEAIEEEVEEDDTPEFAPAVELEDEGIVIEREDVFRPRTDYVSKFEKLADASREEDNQPRRRRRRKDHHEPVNTAELLKEKEYEIVPEYTDEELAEIERQQAELESTWYEEEIDFDLFDEFYDEE